MIAGQSPPRARDGAALRELFAGALTNERLVQVHGVPPDQLDAWFQDRIEREELSHAYVVLSEPAKAHLQKIGATRAQAEDTLAETVLSTVEEIDRGRVIPAKAFRAYFYRVLHNNYFTKCKTMEREVLVGQDPRGDSGRSPGRTSDDDIRLREAVLECIADLPDDLRALVRNRYYRQEQLKSYAARVGISSVKACRLHTRALSRVFLCLKRRGMAPLAVPARKGMRRSGSATSTL